MGRQFGHDDWTGSLQLMWSCFAQDKALLGCAAVFVASAPALLILSHLFDQCMT